MTRVNVGILVSELCDQHLIAEYKELPRCFATRTDANLVGFRLGRGHQLWCAQFQRSLKARQYLLCNEMRYRGFNVNFPTSMEDVERAEGVWSKEDVEEGRLQLIDRIRDRLGSMRRDPVWTNRPIPAWAKQSLIRRAA